jgi:hypothetical protein
MSYQTLEERMLNPETHQETGDSIARVMDNAKAAGLKLPPLQLEEWQNLLDRTGWRPKKLEAEEYPIARPGVWSKLPNLGEPEKLQGECMTCGKITCEAITTFGVKRWNCEGVSCLPF